MSGLRDRVSNTLGITSHLEFTWLSEWDGDLMRCPSQRYRRFRLQLVGHFIFEAQAYLRWRSLDEDAPWGAAIIPIDPEEYRFWADVPEISNYKHDHCVYAQNWMSDWVEKNQWVIASRVAQSVVLKAQRFHNRVEYAIFEHLAERVPETPRRRHGAAMAGSSARRKHRKTPRG